MTDMMAIHIASALQSDHKSEMSDTDVCRTCRYAYVWRIKEIADANCMHFFI